MAYTIYGELVGLTAESGTARITRDGIQPNASMNWGVEYHEAASAQASAAQDLLAVR
jgi:hypothetical protein